MKEILELYKFNFDKLTKKDRREFYLKQIIILLPIFLIYLIIFMSLIIVKISVLKSLFNLIFCFIYFGFLFIKFAEYIELKLFFESDPINSLNLLENKNLFKIFMKNNYILIIAATIINIIILIIY